MKIRAKSAIVAIALMASAALLSGCLSEEISETPADTGSDTTSNNMPSISGNPANAIMVGNMYAFQPAASDQDGDSLTFTINNRPRWATFNSSTGQLSGQPLLGDEGVYQSIVVSVSDGIQTSSLPAFSITVTQGALGSMSLSWTAPMENTDGTALTDLSGFRIYYGNMEGNYPNRVEISNVGMASIVIENLLPDTYFVVATSINSVGVESTYSNVVEKLVEGS